MNIDKTSNGINYEYESTETDKSRFILYPEQSKHTDEEVKKAQSELRSKYNVLSLQVRWKQLGDESPNPEKIPDYLIIKHLKQKIGELESLILENEHKHQKDLLEEQKSIRKEIQAEKLYNEIKAANKILKNSNTSLRKTISDLVSRQNA